MTRNLLFIIVLALSIFQNSLFAQKISGVILSASDSLSIPGATIQILDSDSTFMGGTSTDANGSFVINVTKNKSMKLIIISSIGFSTEQISIEGKAKDIINIGKIYLKESNTELAEVVVKANNQIDKVDKSIIFPSKNQLRVSNSSLSLLHNLNLSGLYIDVLEQKISINGSQPVYMIDGVVKSKHEFLTVNPKDIKRIEYEESPSIRNIDKGAGGTINLILKEKNDGGSFWGNVLASPMTGFINSDIYLSYNKAKSEFSINYFNNWRDYKHRWTDKVETFIAPDKTIERKFTGVNSPFGYLSQGVYLNYTYQADVNTMFNATFRNDFGKQHTSINGEIAESRKPDNYFRNSKALFNSYMPALDLFFSKKLKNNQSFEINIVGTLQDATYNRTLSDNMSTGVNEITNKIDNLRKSVISEIIYRKQFKKVRLNLGYQNTISQTTNVYDELSSKKENLYENNNYVFGALSGKINKFSYNIGSGMKIFSVDNTLDKRLFVKNQSTLSMMYVFNKHLNIKLNSFYTPHLPALSQLSDVAQVYDEFMIIKGNPKLKAAHTVGSKLFLNYNIDKFNLNLSSGYQQKTNSIYMDIRHSKDNVFISQFQNAINDKLLNVEAKGSLKGLFNHVNLYSTVGYNYFTSKGADFNHHLGDFYWNFSAQVYWNKWTLSAYYVKPKKRLYNQILDLGENNSQISLGYKHKNLDLFAAIKYPFEKNGWQWSEKNLSKINPSSTDVFIKDNSRMVVLGVTYSLNFGKRLNKSNKNLNNVDRSTSILKVQE